MFFRKTLSEGAKGLIHSLTNTPEDWREWEFQYTATGESGKEPELWQHKNGAIIYCSESKYPKSMNVENKLHSDLKGFVVLEPHTLRFSDHENKALLKAFNYMVSKRTALSVVGHAPIMTYAELTLLAEELIENNAAYCLTSANEKLREWTRRLLKDKKDKK